MHHVALDGSRAHDCHLNNEVVEADRLQARQHRHLRSTLDLKHADRIGASQHVVNSRILARYVGERIDLSVMQRDEVEGLADAGEHAKRQYIHFQHAERVDVILVPFEEGSVLHGAIVDRHGFIETFPRQHEAADVLGEMARKTEQGAGETDRLLDLWIGRIETCLADVFVGDLTVALAPDQACKTGRYVFLKAHRFADLADRHAWTVVNDGGADGGAFATIAFIQILDHLLAPLMFKIYVDVGWLATVGRNEPFEQKINLGGVNRGNAEAIAHGAVSGRAAPLAEDRFFQLASVADDIVDGEEITGVVELGDEGEFLIDQSLYFRRHAMWIAQSRVMGRQRLKIGLRHLAGWDRFLRVLITQLFEIERNPLHNLGRPDNGLRIT